MEKGNELLVLVEQYKLAGDLYKHEDDLNWKKLNNLFYVNAAMWAIYGFVLRGYNPDHGILENPNLLISVMSLIGIITCFFFAVALLCGIKYLQMRKDSMIDLEKKVVDLGGKHIVSLAEKERNEKAGLKQRSWTIHVLRLSPILPAVIWIVIFFSRSKYFGM